MDLTTEHLRYRSFDLVSLTVFPTTMLAATLPPRSSAMDCTGSSRSSHRWLHRLLTFSAALMSLGMSGCMSARLEELRYAPTQSLRTGDSVVLLGRTRIDGKGVEADFLTCLHRRLSGATLTEAKTAEVMIQPLQFASGTADKVGTPAARLELFPQRQFIDAFYPWLEPSSAPTDGAGLETFLSRPGVRERVTSMGVRYIVWVDGATQKVDSGGSINCGIFGSGAGCFGLGWWQKKSSYEATIWDLDNAVGAGSVSTSVNGFSAVLGVVVPVPLIAPVQGTACRRLSSQLHAFMRNEIYR